MHLTGEQYKKYKDQNPLKSNEDGKKVADSEL